MLNAGNMRHRIEVQNYTAGAWAHVAWQHAEIRPKGAIQFFARGVPMDGITHMVRTRYNQELFPRSRILIPAHGQMLAAGANAGDATLSLVLPFAGQSWPYYVRVDDEIMHVTAGYGGSTLTVSRGQFGTTAASHTGGQAVVRMDILTVGSIDNTKQINDAVSCYCSDVSQVMAGMFTQSATIQRATAGSGPQPTETWATLSSSVPVRIHQLSGKEIDLPTEATVATMRAYLPYGTDITGRDRIVIGTATYVCLFENTDPGSQGAYMTVDCREVR